MGTADLRTPRLRLRRWRRSDREPFATMNADPAVMEYFPDVLTRDESDALVDRIEAHFAEHGYGLWAVEVVGGPEFVGFVGLSWAVFDAPFTPALEVGWRLDRTAWGHGYATEAGTAAVRYGFGTGVDEIVSFTAVGNARSRAVMERIGLRHDASAGFEHPRIAPGHPLRPHVLYRARGDEWLAAHP
jgi:ribosomal-protein-alanine N-acetyltransferase